MYTVRGTAIVLVIAADAFIIGEAIAHAFNNGHAVAIVYVAALLVFATWMNVRGIKLAGLAEKIVTTVDARDLSVSPGDEQVNKYKEKLTTHPYFQAVLGKTNEVLLQNLSRPTSSQELGTYVDFSLVIRYPDKTR